MVAVSGLAVVWGSLMKLVVYNYLWQQNVKEKPISILTLVDQVNIFFSNIWSDAFPLSINHTINPH
jgi:hypothetical protein